MSKYSLASLFCIQLFGEGAGGGDGGTGTGGTGAAAPTGQETTAAPAQPQRKGVKANPLADVKYGIQDEAPVAEAQQAAAPAADPVDRNAQFEALIKGEYKDLYDARVQNTVRERLKGNEATVQKYNSLTPTLELLAGKYGVDVNDIEALNKAIEDDETFYEDEALEKGISVQQVKEYRKMMRENAQLKAERDRAQDRERMERQFAALTRDAEALKQKYPNFDLNTETQNKDFVSLIRAGVPLETAFMVIHKDEIIPAAMQYTAKQVEQKVVNNIRAGTQRPAEGAMGGQSATLVKSDVSQLTKADRKEINRRVARGEKIRF